MKTLGYYQVVVGTETYVSVSFSVYREIKAEPSECVVTGPTVLVPKRYLESEIH